MTTDERRDAIDAMSDAAYEAAKNVLKRSGLELTEEDYEDLLQATFARLAY